MKIVMTTEYKNYVDDLTSNNFARNASNLFKAKPCGDKSRELILNIPHDPLSASHSINDESKSDVPEYLELPLLPNCDTLAADSGKKLGAESTLTGLTANTATLAPINVYHSIKDGYANGSTLTIQKAFWSKNRKGLTWYYLHIMNNKNTKYFFVNAWLVFNSLQVPSRRSYFWRVILLSMMPFIQQECTSILSSFVTQK